MTSADAGGAYGSNLLADLVAMDPADRRPFYRASSVREKAVLATRARRDLGSPYGLWQDDPVGFVEDVLGDSLWSGQIRLVEAVRDHQKVAAPATHSPGKSFSGGRLVAWWCSVWPLGTAQAITTAPKMRQVEQVMWPGIRNAARAGQLPGNVLSRTWKVGDFTLAYGFSAADRDEDAAQGIHWPHLLFIIDEAGGIAHTLGRSYQAVMSNPHARMLMIGNPPTDEEGTWFEDQCEKAVGDSVEVVRISAYDTPAFTGEVAPRCTSCPEGVPPHRVTMHLTTPQWVNETIAEFGEDSAFVVARVHALFPTILGQRVMPYAWVQAAADVDQEAAPGNWVRLGVDLASDGGDEFVIARAVGFNVEVVHRSSGAANADPVNLGGKIMEQIHDAILLRERVGNEQPIHVKIDASGLGWGVAGYVKRIVEEQHLPVLVRPIRGEDPPVDEVQFMNARSELWWNMRRLVKPETDPATGQVTRGGKVKLINPPTRLLAQLSGPLYSNDSRGRIVVEKKREMKARTTGSPDLADAVNLALYEPPGPAPASLERATTTIPTGARGMQRPVVGAGGPNNVVPLGPPRR